MATANWREGRRKKGWTQMYAAQQLGISQAYLSQLERGARPTTEELSRKAMKLYGLPPTALPLPCSRVADSPNQVQQELAALNYPGFSHIRTAAKINPAQAVFNALIQPDLDTRLVEALPWVLCAYPDLDWIWLLNSLKLRNAQNRLGYVLYLAKQVARPEVAKVLGVWEQPLEEARLAKEGTLCRDSMPCREREWLKDHRSEAAAHWGLLTSLTPDQLFYAEGA